MSAYEVTKYDFYRLNSTKVVPYVPVGSGAQPEPSFFYTKVLHGLLTLNAIKGEAYKIFSVAKTNKKGSDLT